MLQYTFSALLTILVVGTSSSRSLSAELRTYQFADVGRSFHVTCSECTLNDYAKVVGSFDLSIDDSLGAVEITRFDATLVDPIREVYSGVPASWIAGANLRELLPGDVTSSVGSFANPDLVEFEPVETPHANPWEAYTTRFSLLLSGNEATLNLSSIPHVDPDGPRYYSLVDLRAELVPEPIAALLMTFGAVVSAVGLRPARLNI
jgi:hypothetical protein